MTPPSDPKAEPLKPCPFCGKDANYDCTNNGKEHGVNCSNEFCIGYYMGGAETQGYYLKKYAYEAWNTRKDTAAPTCDKRKAALAWATGEATDLNCYRANTVVSDNEGRQLKERAAILETIRAALMQGDAADTLANSLQAMLDMIYEGVPESEWPAIKSCAKAALLAHRSHK